MRRGDNASICEAIFGYRLLPLLLFILALISLICLELDVKTLRPKDTKQSESKKSLEVKP